MTLSKAAKRIRSESISSIYLAKSGHPGGTLSAIDIIIYLFFKEMAYNMHK